MNESVVQQQVRLALARAGAQMWRNNVGACETVDGRQIRYGLANDSSQLNARIKSSDLIGCVPMLIGPEHVGKVIGVFAAVECKHSGWHLTPGDKRGVAQAAFHAIIHAVGGVAGFATSPDDLNRIMVIP
jgi:hypothetical protein